MSEPTEADDLREYFATFFGYEGAYGWLHFATGDPYLNDMGRIKHKNWREWAFERTAVDRGRLLAAVLDEAAEHDVFICPYLTNRPERHKGIATNIRFVHSEVDDDLDLEKVDAVGGFVVASGSPGHGHVYVPLSRWVDFWEHETLCAGLGEYLDAKDHKISDNDLLRPPGSFNRKPTLRGEPPTPVAWKVRPSGVLVVPEELAANLGIDLAAKFDWTKPPDSKPSRSRRPRGSGAWSEEPTEVVDLDAWHMGVVSAVLTKDTGDRSADIMRVIGACVRSGLTLPHTRWVVRSREDLDQKLDELTHDDVERCFAKATASHDDGKHQKQVWVKSSKRRKRAAWSAGKR